MVWSIIEAARTGLSLETFRTAKWAGWIIAASLIGTLAAKSTGFYFTSLWAIMAQTVIFSSIITAAAGAYRGNEGDLVRQTIRRMLNPFIRKDGI